MILIPFYYYLFYHLIDTNISNNIIYKKKPWNHNSKPLHENPIYMLFCKHPHRKYHWNWNNHTLTHTQINITIMMAGMSIDGFFLLVVDNNGNSLKAFSFKFNQLVVVLTTTNFTSFTFTKLLYTNLTQLKFSLISHPLWGKGMEIWKNKKCVKSLKNVAFTDKGAIHNLIIIVHVHCFL